MLSTFTAGGRVLRGLSYVDMPDRCDNPDVPQDVVEFMCGLARKYFGGIVGVRTPEWTPEGKLTNMVMVKEGTLANDPVRKTYLLVTERYDGTHSITPWVSCEVSFTLRNRYFALVNDQLKTGNFNRLPEVPGASDIKTLRQEVFPKFMQRMAREMGNDALAFSKAPGFFTKALFAQLDEDGQMVACPKAEGRFSTVMRPGTEAVVEKSFEVTNAVQQARKITEADEAAVREYCDEMGGGNAVVQYILEIASERGLTVADIAKRNNKRTQTARPTSLPGAHRTDVSSLMGDADSI